MIHIVSARDEPLAYEHAFNSRLAIILHPCLKVGPSVEAVGFAHRTLIALSPRPSEKTATATPSRSRYRPHPVVS
jgi:hypothetical protein